MPPAVFRADGHSGQPDEHDREDQQGGDHIYLCGDLPADHAVDLDGESQLIGPGDKIADDDVVDGQRDGHESAGQDPGGQNRQGDALHGAPLICAEVHGGFLQRAVEVRDARPQRDDHEGKAEGHMGKHQRPEAHRHPHAAETYISRPAFSRRSYSRLMHSSANADFEV